MFKNFNNIDGLRYGLSQKSDGPMELARNGLANAPHRRKFFMRQGIGPAKTVSPDQPHSARVKKVGADDTGKVIPLVDGLFTDAPKVFLTATVADCFPIYFYNPVSKSVGLVHSGWRGTVGNIVGEMLKAMAGNPADIFVGIGPGIGSCHFEIKDDVVENFNGYPEAIIHRAGKIFVDLPKIIRKQLIESGVNNQNIETCGECAFCENKKYFSFRRDKPKSVEAMIGYIGLS